MLDDLIRIIIEIIDQRILYIVGGGLDIVVMLLRDAEKHLQYRDDKGKGEYRHQRRKDVEDEVQDDIFLIFQPEPFKKEPEVFHLLQCKVTT